MTTYNTYQEAKIANPEMEVYKLAAGFIATNEPQGVSVHKCNPADDCMTVEKFLADGHKFAEGDLILDEGVTWTVSDKVNSDTYIYTVKSSNKPDIDDNDRYILRAAALENQVNIDNLATQTPEEKEVLDSINSDSPDFDANFERYSQKLEDSIDDGSLDRAVKEALDLIDTTPHQYEMSKFSGNEWNGEGLPPVGSLCKVNRDSFTYRVMYSSEYVVIVQNLDNDNTTAHGMDIILDLHKGNYTFSKPESPQQREERECLEAAYDLYAHWNDVLGRDDVSHISNFKEDDNYALFRFFIARSRNLI